MKTPENHKFVSEAIKPVDASFDTSSMVAGAPGLPQRFLWRKREYVVSEVLNAWTTTSDCKHGSGEQYVDKHWFLVRTEDNIEMQIYFERRPRSGQAKKRWWIASVERS